jgi:ATP-binding cassette subfamily C (CFTR/MRP) protein 1
LSFADTIIALEDGRIIETGAPHSYLARRGSVAKPGLNSQEEDFDLEDAHSDDTTIPRGANLVVESLPSTPQNEDGHSQALDAKRKQGDWSVYSYYLSSSGYAIVILFLASMAIWVFCTEFASSFKLLPSSLGSD